MLYVTYVIRNEKSKSYRMLLKSRKLATSVSQIYISKIGELTTFENIPAYMWLVKMS